jgi:hypothetical protein
MQLILWPISQRRVSFIIGHLNVKKVCMPWRPNWKIIYVSCFPIGDALPSPKLDPNWVQVTQQRKCEGFGARSQPSALKRGRGACWSSRIRLGRGTSYSLIRTCIKTNHKVVSPHSRSLLVLGQATGNTDSLDSPWLGFGGSHHLPPYNILCVTLRRLHPNDFLSRDSQSGVPKLSRFGLSGLWTVIASRPDLRSGQGLNQCCSYRQELSNAISHSPSARQERVDSWLLVVGSQTASLTPGPSFAHNLGWRCPNDSCEAILDIYTSWNFPTV